MGERVFLDPLEHNMRWLKHSVTLDPAEKLWIDLQMFIGLAEHDDACGSGAARNGRPHSIPKLHRRAIVILHGSERLTRSRPNYSAISWEKGNNSA